TGRACTGTRCGPTAARRRPSGSPCSCRRRCNLLKVVGIAVAVGLLAAAGTFLATRSVVHGDTPVDPTPTAAETTGPEPTSSVTPAVAPPSGYHWVDDPAGFRFPLPNGTPSWQRITAGDNQIFYSPDNKLHYLQFAVTVGQSVKPLDHMRQLEANVSKSLKDYKQHRMAASAVKGQEAAVWEFSYLAKEGGRRRAIETEFIGQDGTSYAIYSSSPERGNEWTEAEQRFNAVLNAFTPIR
ncbi:hypothetical protein ABZW03_37675, partial [Kitasatospora sp. NPDC004799]